MPPSVAESWHTITDWLRANAPATHAALNPPAEEAEVAALAAHGGLQLPDDLFAWWSLANGARDLGAVARLLVDYRPLSAAESLRERQVFIGEVARTVVQPDPECDVAGEFAGP